ncbi:MAG: hypothetical protein EA355_00960, partial [Rhodobacteraceae bacterium]
VPLYVEEMTKAVLESGALRETAGAWVLDGPLDRLAIPASLHDSLMARLDRLQPVKEVAQTAAVIGRAFDLATLRALSPLPEAALAEALERLVAAELVFRRGAAPETSYLFKHALVRDAAYESLLRSRRQALHRHLVAILETTGAEPELLARHAQAGGETARAVAWWRAAAKAAIGRGAFDEAAAHLDAAQALTPGLPDERARRGAVAGVAAARALASLVRDGYADPRTVSLYAEAAALAREADDPAVLLSATYGVWAGHHVADAVGPALAVAAEIRGDAARTGDTDLEMMGDRSLAVSLTMAGRFDEARSAYERATALYDPSRHRAYAADIGVDPIVGTKCYSALAELALGHADRASSLIDEARILSKLAGGLNGQGYMLYHAAALAAAARRSAEAVALAEELGALSSRHGLALWGSMAPGVAGIGRLELGDARAALAQFAQWLTDAEATRAGVLAALKRAAMAEAMAVTGEDAALAMAVAAETHARRTGARYALAEAQRRHGIVLRLLRPDNHADAEAAFRRAIATAREQNARLWELRAACDLARLLDNEDRGAEARALLAPLCDGFTEGLDTPDLIDAWALLDHAP